MAESLTSRTVHGLKWSYLSTLIVMALQIAVTAVLARLVTPAEYGLVAMAAVFLRFGQYFAQLGVGQALVQKRELSVVDMRTAFTSSLLIGAAFAALFAALAPLAGALFPDASAVVDVTRVMALTFLISGLTAATQGLLRRRFVFRAIALVEICSFLVGYALVSISLAIAGFGVWSLVAGSLAQGMLTALSYAALCRADLGFGLNGPSFKALYSFGGRVSLIGFGEFIAANLDTLWAGHVLGSQPTGLYTRATNLATVPLQQVTVTLSRVLLPAFSQIQSDVGRLRKTYLATITVVAALVFPTAWGLAGAANEVIAVLLGAQWGAAAPVLAILALAAPFPLLTHFAAVICEATAALNIKIIITLTRIAGLAVLLVLLSPHGIVGIAIAFGLVQVVTHGAYILVMRRLLALPLAKQAPSYVPGLPGGVAAGLTLLALDVALGRLHWPPTAILALQLTVGLIILATVVLRIRGGRVWHEIETRLREAGYRGEMPGMAGWVIRRLDALAAEHR